jgi:hypothetical protein
MHVDFACSGGSLTTRTFVHSHTLSAHDTPQALLELLHRRGIGRGSEATLQEVLGDPEVAAAWPIGLMGGPPRRAEAGPLDGGVVGGEVSPGNSLADSHDTFRFSEEEGVEWGRGEDGEGAWGPRRAKAARRSGHGQAHARRQQQQQHAQRAGRRGPSGAVPDGLAQQSLGTEEGQGFPGAAEMALPPHEVRGRVWVHAVHVRRGVQTIRPIYMCTMSF